MPLEPGTELAHVRSVWTRIQASNSAIYNFLLPDIEIVSAGPGTVTAYLVVGKPHINSKAILHGAVSATLVDWAGGLAIAASGLEKTGVSTDIHTSYISSAKEGDTLVIEGKANKVGNALAYTSVEIRRLSDNAFIAVGLHTKYVKQRD